MALQCVVSLLFVLVSVQALPPNRFNQLNNRFNHLVPRDLPPNPTMGPFIHPLDPSIPLQDYFHVPSTPLPYMFTGPPPVVNFDSVWIQPTRRPSEPEAPQTEAPKAPESSHEVVVSGDSSAQNTADVILSKMEDEIVALALDSNKSPNPELATFLAAVDGPLDFHQVHLVISTLGCPDNCLTCAENAAAECPICYERCVACVMKKCSSSCVDNICADAVADTCGKFPSCGERCKNCDCARNP